VWETVGVREFEEVAVRVAVRVFVREVVMVGDWEREMV